MVGTCTGRVNGERFVGTVRRLNLLNLFNDRNLFIQSFWPEDNSDKAATTFNALLVASVIEFISSGCALNNTSCTKEWC